MNDPSFQPADEQPGQQASGQVVTRTARSAPTSGSLASNGVSFLTATSIALVVSAFVFYVLAQYEGRILAAIGLTPAAPPGAKRLVVLDSNRIVNTAMRRLVATPGVTPQQASAAGVQMARQLEGVLGDYRGRGVIVLNAAVAVAWPAEADITRQVADRVGVALE